MSQPEGRAELDYCRSGNFSVGSEDMEARDYEDGGVRNNMGLYDDEEEEDESVRVLEEGKIFH